MQRKKNLILPAAAAAVAVTAEETAAKADIGVKKLLGGIAAYLPAPAATVLGTEPGTGELVERGISEAFSAQAFKTVVDPQSGRQTYLRIETGTLRGDTTVLDVTTGRAERIGSLSTLRADRYNRLTLFCCLSLQCTRRPEC